MKKYYKLILSVSSLIFLPGCCTSVSECWTDFVEMLETNMAAFLCYIYYIFAHIINYLVDMFVNVALTLLILLPEVQLPDVSGISNIPFIKYCAYFVPIKEGAVLVSAIITGYLSFIVVRMILRLIRLVK